jgi:hypothetical protein
MLYNEFYGSFKLTSPLSDSANVANTFPWVITSGIKAT